MTLLASLTFVTPLDGMLALGVLVPLGAFVVAAVQGSRGRTLLGLAPPQERGYGTLAAVLAIPLLLGLAAAGPAWRTHVGRRIRKDTQAIFIFDTSRSMSAAAASGDETRFAQAQAAAIKLRDDAIPDVPSGIASLTTQLLPQLFPTTDEAVFNSTVENAIGIEKPPPPALQFGVTGTSFWALTALRNQGYFNPTVTHRFAILLTDGESGPYDADALGKILEQAGATIPAPGQTLRPPEPPVPVFVVRVGAATDHIYQGKGGIEVAYRADPRAPLIVNALAAATQGHAFAVADLGAAEKALRTAVAAAGTSVQGVDTKTITLAPYVVLVAIAALALVIRRRNLNRI